MNTNKEQSIKLFVRFLKIGSDAFWSNLWLISVLLGNQGPGISICSLDWLSGCRNILLFLFLWKRQAQRYTADYNILKHWTVREAVTKTLNLWSRSYPAGEGGTMGHFRESSYAYLWFANCTIQTTINSTTLIHKGNASSATINTRKTYRLILPVTTADDHTHLDFFQCSKPMCLALFSPKTNFVVIYESQFHTNFNIYDHIDLISPT